MRPAARALALAFLLLGTAHELPAVDLQPILSLLEDGRAAEAEARLRQIPSTEGGAVVHDLLGVAISRQGRMDEAKAEFRRAIEADPELLAARQHLARIHLQQGEAEEALSVLRAAADLGPLDRDLALFLAEEALRRGAFPLAAGQLRSVIERFDSVRALMQLARLNVRRGDRDAALELLERARELAPSSEEVLAAVAKVSLDATAPATAVRVLEPLTRMVPEEPEYPYLLGVARLQLAETESAVDALFHSLELEPDRTLTLIALGLAYNTQKRYENAKEVLVRALDLSPGNPEALSPLAEAEEGLQDLEAAERHALRALERVPNHSLALFVLGKIRMRQERFEEARDALERAVETDPKSAKAHYQLSLALARLGDREASRRHLELYREALQAAEDEIAELRTKAGLGLEGM